MVHVFLSFFFFFWFIIAFQWEINELYSLLLTVWILSSTVLVIPTIIIIKNTRSLKQNVIYMAQNLSNGNLELNKRWMKTMSWLYLWLFLKIVTVIGSKIFLWFYVQEGVQESNKDGKKHLYTYAALNLKFLLNTYILQILGIWKAWFNSFLNWTNHVNQLL